MIGTRSPLRPVPVTVQPVDDAIAVVDGALASVASRDAVSQAEAIALLETVRASSADLGAAAAVSLIVGNLTTTYQDAALVGCPTVADALLDIRLALASS